jgi:predicted alpha/beta hydrolase
MLRTMRRARWAAEISDDVTRPSADSRHDMHCLTNRAGAPYTRRAISPKAMTTAAQHHFDSPDHSAPARTATPQFRLHSTTRQPHRIVAADGYALATHRFQTSQAPRGVVVMAGAIGVPQRFYHRFAEFACERGHDVVTFDYRGIAGSAPPSLRGFRMDFRDWGRLDMAAVVDAGASHAVSLGVPLYVVAHSFGGHALGMLPNHDRVRACLTYGTGAGWHGWMPNGERLKVMALWNIVGPMLTAWKGYLPWSILGMGEDLPLDVYRQWRKWCQYPRFFFDDPEIGAEMRTMYARVRTPILALSALDDAWSPPRSRDAFLSGYSNATRQTQDLDARQLGTGALGHMGYFRSRAATLWPAALDWLESVG